ncbi:hypothetical protein [Luteimonas sp. MC1750]|uniref:hypothetical protein n=1 Tax=Luteimonas sp. MC1750 TaxID=2799326 RepID=UPI0018F10584|nr:hypothetical protein [Luteimonas sp. MC1750]MBJ6984708.1 hypothetical protein [Luteimonas sp. MC1750]QQO04695.1 hypothetical protein JGR68_07230 [Luteimonas sp. MC1750]
MVVRLLVLVVLAAVAVVAWDTGWRIDESHVHRYYQGQVDAIRNFDHESMCKDIAGDFSLEATSYVDGQRTEEAAFDGESTCRMTREMLDGMRRLSSQSRGLLTFDVNVDVRSIRIEPGRRKATVESITTVKMGDVLVSRSRGTERLSRSVWRVRSHGGEGQTWTYLF